MLLETGLWGSMLFMRHARDGAAAAAGFFLLMRAYGGPILLRCRHISLADIRRHLRRMPPLMMMFDARLAGRNNASAAYDASRRFY